MEFLWTCELFLKSRIGYWVSSKNWVLGLAFSVSFPIQQKLIYFVFFKHVKLKSFLNTIVFCFLVLPSPQYDKSVSDYVTPTFPSLWF